MRIPHRLAAAVPAVLLTASCSVPSPTAGSSAGDGAPKPTGGGAMSLAAAVKRLPVRAPHESGYDRAKFRLWVDADHDGCDTRKEVLLRGSETRPRQGPRCKLSGGRWRSFYDGRVVTRDRQLDIDHLVPLANSWASGAWRWSAAKRERYANDLGASTSLVAVSLSTNRSKGDRGPAEWMPPLPSAACPYAVDWVATKLRWGLSVTAAEKAKLASLGRQCPRSEVSFRPAS